MSTALLVSLVSIGLAIFALIVAGVALWSENLAPFKALCTVGNLCFRVYPISSEGESWFIASADLTLTVTNDGARPGRVLGLRLRVTYPKLPIVNHYELFGPRWEIDRREIKSERFDWVENAKQWMPYVVLSKASVTKHLVFECRWEEPVIQEEVRFELQLYSDAGGRWSDIAEWNMPLRPRNWAAFASGQSLLLSPEGNIDEIGPYDRHPADLSKYTASREPIPDFVPTAPSELSYSNVQKAEKPPP